MVPLKIEEKFMLRALIRADTEWKEKRNGRKIICQQLHGINICWAQRNVTCVWSGFIWHRLPDSMMTEAAWGCFLSFLFPLASKQKHTADKKKQTNKPHTERKRERAYRSVSKIPKHQTIHWSRWTCAVTQWKPTELYGCTCTATLLAVCELIIIRLQQPTPHLCHLSCHWNIQVDEGACSLHYSFIYYHYL